MDYLSGFWLPASGPVGRLVILTILIGGLALVNVRVKMATQVSNVFTVAKLFPLLILVGGRAFLYSGSWQPGSDGG